MYDAIVIGAGVEGSATAYQLIKRGVSVLLLEQFPLPHSRGSSHGQSRITRKAYAEPFYTAMMHYCSQQWDQLQKDTKQTLFKKNGFLAIGPMDGPQVINTKASLDENGAENHLLSPAELRERYPMFRYADEWGAVLDPEGGILMADKILQAFQSQFVKYGGTLRDGEQVVGIEPGTVCHVNTSKGRYDAKSLILCCGSWTNKMLLPLQLRLPLQPIRISVCYWPERVLGSHSSDLCPTFFEMTDADQEVYGLPSLEYPGHVKMVLHHGPEVDPDRRDDVNSQWPVNFMKKYIAQHFPGLYPEPSVIESCMYTNTPDRHLILDRHPKWSNIIIGAGFSGHGFKLSPAVGKILADLALDTPTSYDISHFKINRFSKSTSVDSKL